MPPLQFNPDDVRSGIVKVYAKSPSGRNQLMEVVENGGMYNANFTPDEIGDWKISILHDGKHIDGSPFNVRVYDPGQVRVTGLDAGLAGRNYNFIIDASQAGEGPLTIDITHNGQIIPAQILPDPRHKRQFTVHFTPQGSGYYTIRVYFAEMEISGSPYTVEIIDAAAVTASGPGLTSGQVQHRSVFTVNISNSGGTAADLRIVVSDPRGIQIPTNVVDQHDGSLRVEFVPLTVGQHKIDVLYSGKPIAGSPFLCVVSDWNQITVTNLPSNACVGKAVEFDVDATQAGPGDLEIMVNGGSVPCNIQNRGERRFHVSFTPRTAMSYDIQVRFNGKEVAGGPWRVDVLSAAYLTVVGEGLQLVPVNTPTWFEVRGTGGKCFSGALLVNITSPSGRMVRNTITDLPSSGYRVEYTPVEPGVYPIEVLFDSAPVPGSPFHCKAYDVSAVSCGPAPIGIVDKPVELTVDASRAGEGQLEITVNRGTVPNAAKPLGKGLFIVTFTPKEAKVHTVDIEFNGEPTKCSPLSVPVLDVSKIQLQCQGQLVPVSRPAVVHVNAQGAGDAELTVQMTSPSKRNVPTRVSGSASRGFDVEFTPMESGIYRMSLQYGGLDVPLGQVEIVAFDVSKVRVSDIQDAIVNQETTFKVDLNATADGELDVMVTGPTGLPVFNYIKPIMQGIVAVNFTPIQSGVHTINIAFNGETLPGSPFRVNAIDPSKATARGDGLDIIQTGQPTSFFVSAPGAFAKDFDVRVVGPNAKDVLYRMSEAGSGSFKVDYTPVIPGEYRIEVSYFSQPIPGSPFVAKAWDVNKVIVSNIATGRVGTQSNFSINVKDAGEGTLEIGIAGPSGQNISNSVNALGPGHFIVSYIPLESGQHRANITFNGESVNGNPFLFMVNDPSRVSARGDGLGFVNCGQPTSFIITAPGAQLKDLDVRITGPGNKDIIPRLSDGGGSTFKATYTPIIAGDYTIDVTYFDQPILGSPFVAQASDISKVSVSNISTGYVGQQASFCIDVKNAGDGTLEISISGPSGQNIANTVTPQGPGQFLVSFIPVENGQHRANVIFNKESVRGNPFTFMVIDPLKATVRGDGIGLVRVGQSTYFVVTAPAAQSSDLDVIITGPNSKQLLPRVVESGPGSFRVDYVPPVAGNYQIEVVYFGQPINGCPFITKAWDSTKVAVSNILPGRVGIQSSFSIDVKEAGEGTLEIGINGPSGQNIPNSVQSLGPCQFEVTFVPNECGPHRANISFNKESVPGSPFQFSVTDLNRASAYGDGLGCVKCNIPTSFFVTAPGAQGKDVGVCITGPSDKLISARVVDQGAGNFKVDYTPTVAGDYKINVTYFEQLLHCCPFIAKAWEISKVIVSDICNGLVNCQSTFVIDAREAGDGSLEIGITGPCGRNVPNTVAPLGPGRFEVTFVPVESGQHYASITFNRENVNGSRFQFLVTDPSHAVAKGEGLGCIRCHQPTSFTLSAPGAQIRDIGVSITGPDNRDIIPRIYESGSCGNFLIEYTPSLVGDYMIAVTYFGEPVFGSPFFAHIWDSSAISVTNIKPGLIGKQSKFNVDASRAGVGNLEVNILAGGQLVPNAVREIGNGLVDVSFTPLTADVHNVTLKYNCELVPGSPFSIPVIDGSRATAQGEGLGHCVVAHKPTSFEVNTKLVGGEADLDVTITSPRGQQLRPKITGSAANGYLVEYTAGEAGRHVVNIKYAEMAITGSPFYPDVYDPCMVRVGQLPQGFVGKLYSFDVDASYAGEGRLAAEVKGQITRPFADVAQKSNGFYTVSFMPQESATYSIGLTFNCLPIPGSPFCATIIDASCLCVDWDAVRLRPVHCPVLISLDPKQSAEADVTCIVTDPQGRNVTTKMLKSARLYNVEFTGHVVGPYLVDLKYGGIPVPGSPFTCNLYDIKRVHLIDVSPMANVGQQAAFTVDASEAGLGDLDVEVLSKEIRVPTQTQQLAKNRNRYTFVPMAPFEHYIVVKFNNVDVPGSPQLVRVINPASQLVLSAMNGGKSVQVGQWATAVVATNGLCINIGDVVAKALAPCGEQLLTRVSSSPDQSVKIEYTSKYSGLHHLDVQYAGQSVQGSPQLTEFFDPSKIIIEGSRTGMVGDPVSLDVIMTDAGKGELAATVTSSRGLVVPYDLKTAACGYQIVYIPRESGLFSTQMTFNGVQIPGCPIQQQIEDNFLPTASGDGLIKGIENRPASFDINANGQRGDLNVRIEGPNTIARCDVQRDAAGLYKVTYTPVEVGYFTATICWNSRPIPGSPFRIKVCNPDKLTVVGGCEAILDDNGRLALKLNERKIINFDASQAGPGEIAVEVLGPRGPVPVDIMPREGSIYTASFVPTCIGEYMMKVYWCGHVLKRCPVVGTVEEEKEPPRDLLIIDIDEEPEEDPSEQCFPQNVVVDGPGLIGGRVLEDAEFFVDASNAGPGKLGVKMMGVKCDVDVAPTRVSQGKFRCVYAAEVAGAYLLSISWGEFQVPGSPFKVTIVSGGDASKVIVSGAGLNGGIMGQGELCVNVDTKKAGAGDLTATCTGPTKPAYCRLEEQQNGLYLLYIKPQEAGCHQLKVTFGEQQVTGSPFSFNVLPGIDPTKVRVSGPGIEPGILATYQSTFLVETTGAGPGKLTVRVRGPKGAFRVEMTRDPSRDRAILCRYNPAEVGQYIISIKWSGQDVPGSPFTVTIVDTFSEFERAKNGGNDNQYFNADQLSRLQISNTTSSGVEGFGDYGIIGDNGISNAYGNYGDIGSGFNGYKSLGKASVLNGDDLIFSDDS